MAKSVVRRNKESARMRNQSDIANFVYNEDASAYKVMDGLIGRLVPRGAANVALDFDAGTSVALYNNSATVAYVAFGTSNALAVPTGPTDGIALRPNDYTVVPMGDKKWLRANTATVYAYEVADDSSHFPSGT